MLHSGERDMEIVYLDQGLHRTPERMRSVVQEKIASVESHASEIILGYGLCSKGIAGVQCQHVRLVVPRCHDCITLFLGSRGAYRERIEKQPGTYYLTPGWIREKKDPLGIVETEYAPKLGRDLAVWGMREELRNYTHITFIDTGTGESEALRLRALENAVFFQKKIEYVQGHSDYLQRLLHGPYQEPDFLVLEPGAIIRMEMFFT